MTRRTLPIMLALLGAAACSRAAPVLAPGPSALMAPGAEQSIMATASGLRVVARANAWSFDPPKLERDATPILLELRNDGERPVLVRYNVMSLTDVDGHRFNVIPPYDVNGSVSEQHTVKTPTYGFSRFAIAPYLARYYPGSLRYGGAFAYDPAYYSPYATAYHEHRLPTVEMVQRALPEGVLSPGGVATGFVYFQPLHRDVSALTLAVQIIDANSNAVLGTAQIPFVAR